MPADTWTKPELDTLLRALVSPDVHDKAKKEIASEVRKQCFSPVSGYDKELAHSVLRKLGYDALPPRTMKRSRKATEPV